MFPGLSSMPFSPPNLLGSLIHKQAAAHHLWVYDYWIYILRADFSPDTKTCITNCWLDTFSRSWKNDLIYEDKLIFQPCSDSWLPLEPFWLSTQPVLLLLASKTHQCPHGGQSHSVPWFRLTGSQTLRQQPLQYAIMWCIPVDPKPKPCWPPDQVTWGCHLGDSCKNQNSRWVCTCSFLEDTGEL